MNNVFTITIGDKSFYIKKNDPLALMSKRIRDAFDPSSQRNASFSYDLTDCATYKALKKVAIYCEQHYRDKIPLRDEKSVTLIQLTEWDEDFFKTFNKNLLYQIVLTAYHLDIQHLLTTGCIVVATEIKGKTPEQIRRDFETNNDLTEEPDVASTESGSDEGSVPDASAAIESDSNEDPEPDETATDSNEGSVFDEASAKSNESNEGSEPDAAPTESDSDED